MRILRAVAGFTLAAALVLGTAGCKQGVGERCQVDSDCESGLKCYAGLSQSVPPEGQCQSVNFAPQQDAAAQEDAGSPQDDAAVQEDGQADAQTDVLPDADGDAQQDAA